MIIPAGSAAMSIDTKGEALLVVTKDDDIRLYIEDVLGTEPIVIELGKGQAAFDELISNIKRMSVFSGD
jgi:hypothetical protein